MVCHFWGMGGAPTKTAQKNRDLICKLTSAECSESLEYSGFVRTNRGQELTRMLSSNESGHTTLCKFQDWFGFANRNCTQVR